MMSTIIPEPKTPMTIEDARKLSKKKPKIVCLSGSSRFIDVMAVIAWEMERDGDVIVLHCHLLPRWYGAKEHHQAEAEGCAEHMDEIHLAKIDMADELLVVSVDGYIGESTQREIEYATAARKPIFYLEPSTIPEAAAIEVSGKDGGGG